MTALDTIVLDTADTNTAAPDTMDIATANTDTTEPHATAPKTLYSSTNDVPT